MAREECWRWSGGERMYHEATMQVPILEVVLVWLTFFYFLCSNLPDWER
jgi:hypothetical protein